MGSHNFGGTQHVSKTSGFHNQVSLVIPNVAERRRNWSWIIYQSKKEHGHITQSDTEIQSCLKRNEGELLTVRSLHRQHGTCGKSRTRRQTIQIMRHCRKAGTTRRRENLRKVNTAERLNTQIRRGNFPPFLSANFFNYA